MAPLGRRILFRAVPVGVATAVVGYLLLQLMLAAAHSLTGVQVEQGDPANRWLGVAVFGLIGFALAVGAECVRREKIPIGSPHVSPPRKQG